MRFKITFLFFFLLSFSIFAQQYDDFLGAGHSQGFTVTSSDNNSNPMNSVNGVGYDRNIRTDSRFLSSATLGYDIEDIESISTMSYEAWIDQQMAIPVSITLPKTLDVRELWLETCLENYSQEFCDMNFRNISPIWRTAWFDNVMKNDDQLRQRVAMALSEVVVLSDQSNLQFFAHGLATFYDILSRNAFGNYEDLLNEVTMNLAMGFYLSHLNNPKTDEQLNIRPDENYAREIMQLFTIGLYELNKNGTRKTDAEGKWIPTYDNEDIKGLAKVFTGLGGSEWAIPGIPFPPFFGADYRALDFTVPMKMFEEFHEPGEKVIVGDQVIPAGQTGIEDVEMAVNILFNHDNVGPFLAKRLIQRLVKSNPTPQYIENVADVFNDNGDGVRGDMAAVIKAILLDEEAYECYWVEDFDNGMLRSPMLRHVQLMKGMRAVTQTPIFHNNGITMQALTDQYILSAPTVFNFYSPDYEPNADFSLYDVVAPEFQIYNASTSSNYVNFMMVGIMEKYLERAFPGAELPWSINGSTFNFYERVPDPYKAYFTDEYLLSLGNQPEELVDYLDIVIAGGALTDETRNRIVTSLTGQNMFTPEEAAHYALFLVMIDPDFTIKK